MSGSAGFPTRRSDGSATVAADFKLDIETDEVHAIIESWKVDLDPAQWEPDLMTEPRIEVTEDAVRVVFEVKPGSIRWKDWMVWITRLVTERFGRRAFIGYFDVVADSYHPASPGPENG